MHPGLYFLFQADTSGLGSPFVVIHQARTERDVTIGMRCFNIDSYNLPTVAFLAKMKPDSTWFRAVVVRVGTAHVPHSTH